MKHKNQPIIARANICAGPTYSLTLIHDMLQISTTSIDSGSEDFFAETIDLGSKDAHAIAKTYRKATYNARREGFSALLALPHAFEDASLGWRVFLLCLLSTVADLVTGTIPSLPLIALSGLTAAPRALRTLIEAFSPFRKLTGKKGHVKRPSVLEAIAPLGSASISADPVDYVGGKIKVAGYGKLRAWLPLALVPIVVAENVPAAVVDALLATSPLAMLILCGARKISISRSDFRWDGTAFEVADLDLLDCAEAQMPLLQSEIQCFSEFIRSQGSRRKRIVEGMADFYPVSHVGRYTKILDADPEIRIWSAALSTFRELLRFASEKADWCTREDADRWLLDAWTAALPESAPTPPSENAVAVRGNSPEVFWDFLSGYVHDHLPMVTKSPRSDSTAIATLATFDDGHYIVFPRGQLAAEYDIYLDQHGGAPISTAREGIALAHLLHGSWALPIRTELKENDGAEDRGDLTWRFAYYAKGTAPKGIKDKLPCIAIPLTALPDELCSVLKDYSDHSSGEGFPSPSARATSESDSVTGGDENG